MLEIVNVREQLTWVHSREPRLAHEKGWGREALIRISSAVDLACWDIMGLTPNKIEEAAGN